MPPAGLSETGDERFELFDLQEDPTEIDNRYGDPELEEVTTRLKEELKSKRSRLNVK